MRAGRAAVAHGNPSASSDVKVGYRLLMAAADSARDNVEINLVGLSDASIKERILNDAADLMTEAAGLARDVI
jgi:formiminotetrahydrofolate cyclodeaminase